MMQMLFACGSPVSRLTAAEAEDSLEAALDRILAERTSGPGPDLPGAPLWGPRLGLMETQPGRALRRRDLGQAQPTQRPQISYGFLPRRCRVTGPLRDVMTKQTAKAMRCPNGPAARIPGRSPDPLPRLKGRVSES